MLIVDNYDSFTFNLYYYFCELGITPCVVKNDFVEWISDAMDFVDSFDCIVISPGFGSPDNVPLCVEIIKTFAPYKKILGVCLGHQCIAKAFGGTIKQLPIPMHAKSVICDFAPNELCSHITNPLKVALYHSLYVSNAGECRVIGSARLCDMDIPMILKHPVYKTYGVQFHPESILQEQGKVILNNFLYI